MANKRIKRPKIGRSLRMRCCLEIGIVEVLIHCDGDRINMFRLMISLMNIEHIDEREIGDISKKKTRNVDSLENHFLYLN